MNHKTLLLGSALTCVSMVASAALPAALLDPASYGTFRSRIAAKNVKAARSPKAGSIRKVMAFAGDGCADVEYYGTLVPVVSEDFSKLTAGSEGNPDLSVNLEIDPWMKDENGWNIVDQYGNGIPNPDYEYPWNNMKNEYTDQPGWGVGNAYPAGGMLYFPFSMESPEAKFNSHWLDLTGYDGTFVVEFRARLSEPADPAAMMPTSILVQVAETNGMGPTWNEFEEDFFNYENLSEEWTTFRLIFQGGGPSTIVNIVGMGVSGGMYIDDVAIYSLDCNVKAPQLLGHSEFKSDSFVLNWTPVEGAESYNVDCWYIDSDDSRQYVAKKAMSTETSYKVTGVDARTTYHYTVSANKGQFMSLSPIAREIFDIVAPKMKSSVQIDDEGHVFRGGVEPVSTAFGYNYFAQRERIAESDGRFELTREDFTGWTHPAYEPGEYYTKENPADERVVSLWFPTDLKQQGWYGENFQIYKDYLCLCSFFIACGSTEQDVWCSPEFDLSRDGGKVSVDLKLASSYDYEHQSYSKCAVGLFNWNEVKGDYEQIDVVYIDGLTFDWQDCHVELNGASDRSKVAFFGLGSYADIYLDDIVIAQNYKKGDVFYDPFFFRTWQLAETDYQEDPTTFEFTVPGHASGADIHQTAQAVRMHLTNGSYDGEKVSAFADRAHVAYVEEYEDTNGVALMADGLPAKVNVTDGVIYISNPEGLDVSVTAADGKTAVLGNSSSVSYSASSHGIYVVRVGGNSIKIAF